MRIDLVITELPVGGAERCLTELAVGLDRRQFHVRVLSIGPPPGPERDALVRRLEAARIPFLSMQAASTKAAPAAFVRLRRAFRDDRPETVQTFLHHANVLGTLAARSAQVPRCIGGIRVAQPSRWRSLLERPAIGRMDAVVCVSDAVEAFAREHLIPQRVPSLVIPNGVDLGRFTDVPPADWSRWGIPPDALAALFVGRLDRQKGLEDLFAAAEQFLEGDPRRWLVLAGDGPQRAWAEVACARLPGGRAKCIGWQPDVASLLAAAHLLVLTSRYEGMPNVVLEAMASARPVVCFAVEGTEQLFEDPRLETPENQPVGADRQLVPKGDVEAFSAAASRFLDDDVLRQQVGQENQKRVASRFTLERMIDAYASLYRAV